MEGVDAEFLSGIDEQSLPTAGEASDIQADFEVETLEARARGHAARLMQPLRRAASLAYRSAESDIHNVVAGDAHPHQDWAGQPNSARQA